MAEWSAPQTHNPVVLGSSPALTTTNPWPQQLVFSGKLGFLTMLCSIGIICFSYLLRPTSLCVINTAKGK